MENLITTPATVTTTNSIEWTKTTDGYNGVISGSDAPNYVITRRGGRMDLFIAGSDEPIFKRGNLQTCKEFAQNHLDESLEALEASDAVVEVVLPTPSSEHVKAIQDSFNAGDLIGVEATLSQVRTEAFQEAALAEVSVPEVVPVTVPVPVEVEADPFGDLEVVPVVVQNGPVEEASTLPTVKEERLEWPLVGVKKDGMINDTLCWTSLCGRYQIVRFSLEKRTEYGLQVRAGQFWTTVEADPRLQGGYVKYYPTLRRAVETAEADLYRDNGRPVTGNREDFLTANPEPIRAKTVTPAPVKSESSTEGADDTVPSEKTTTPKTPKAPKPAVARAPKQGGEPSNKEVVYKLWEASEDKPETLAQTCFQAVKEAVKLTTIKGWFASWKRGHTLPACARK